MLILSYVILNLEGNAIFILHIDEEMQLRMLSARDANALFSLTNASREYLQKWLPWLDNIKSEEDTLEFIKSTFYTYNNRQAITAGIFLYEELVGVISFQSLDFTHNIGTIGYWLGEKYQGRGVMTKAVEHLVTYGFENLQLNRIEIRVATRNESSIAIPKRLQFKNEGILRQAERLHQRYVDHVMYSMLREEWDK